MLQRKVKYRHFILVSPEFLVTALITIPHTSVRLLFTVVPSHLSTSVF